VPWWREFASQHADADHNPPAASGAMPLGRDSGELVVSVPNPLNNG